MVVRDPMKLRRRKELARIRAQEWRDDINDDPVRAQAHRDKEAERQRKRRAEKKAKETAKKKEGWD